MTNSVTTDSAAQPTVHDTPDVSVVISPRREAVIIGALSLAAMIVSMMQTLPVPILGRIQSDLGASSAGISWVTTATLLSAAVFTPLLGRYGDQHGKKRTLVGVLVVMVIGSIVRRTGTQSATSHPRTRPPGDRHRHLPAGSVGPARRGPPTQASRRDGIGQRNSRIRQRARPRSHRTSHIGSGCRLPQRLLDGHRVRVACTSRRHHAGAGNQAQERRARRRHRRAEPGRCTPSAPVVDFARPPMGLVLTRDHRRFPGLDRDVRSLGLDREDRRRTTGRHANVQSTGP